MTADWADKLFQHSGARVQVNNDNILLPGKTLCYIIKILLKVYVNMKMLSEHQPEAFILSW